MSMILGVALALLGLIAAAVLGAFWLVLKAAMNQEAASVVPAMTRGLLTRARARLPQDAQPRWEEEWPAGFEEAIEKRPIWAMRQAMSLYAGAGRIARELEPATEAAGKASPRLGSVGSSAIANIDRIRGPLGKVWEFLRRLDADVALQLRRIYGSTSQMRLMNSARILAYLIWLILLLISGWTAAGIADRLIP
ncbi:MAG TPA: hypothetical protein VNM38_07395 [Solirubrobacterales bacterium]|nr:hypothetical protein [Solirubrobacterales bacterium]